MRGEDLLGAWSLRSYVQLRDGAVISHPAGEQPCGLILYTPDGYMSATVQNAGGPLLVSYAGRWSLEGDIITHDCAFNLEPERAGKPVQRIAQLQNGDLILRSPKKQTAEGVVWLELHWVRPI